MKQKNAKNAENDEPFAEHFLDLILLDKGIFIILC